MSVHGGISAPRGRGWGLVPGGCLLWGVPALGGDLVPGGMLPVGLVLGGSGPGGLVPQVVPALGGGVPAPGGTCSGGSWSGDTPQMATAADATHPTGMHSSYYY